MSITITDTLTLDGHEFTAEPRVWDDTTSWHHDDCGGADYHLVEVAGHWSWWAQVSPEVTIRSQVRLSATTDGTVAFADARRRVTEWQALYAW